MPIAIMPGGPAIIPGTPAPIAIPGPAQAIINPNVIATIPLVECVQIIENHHTCIRDALSDTNWNIWKGDMKRVLGLCELEEYVFGDILERPDPTLDPVSARNWSFNDKYAAMIICDNITSAQKIHVGQNNTAHEVWRNLEMIHEVTGNTTIITWIQTLFRCVVEEGDNIKGHLSNLKVIWERINLLSADDFMISDLLFKIIISSSLPPSWDTYTQAYIAKTRHHATRDLFKNMNSQEFMGVLIAESERRLGVKHSVNSGMQAYSTKAKNNKAKGPSLLNRMMSKLMDTKADNN